MPKIAWAASLGEWERVFKNEYYGKILLFRQGFASACTIER